MSDQEKPKFFTKEWFISLFSAIAQSMVGDQEGHIGFYINGGKPTVGPEADHTDRN